MSASPSAVEARRRIVARVLAWYDAHRRDLPWRRPDATPWGVLVSEIMLQQTPVARVLPVWTQWMTQWPTPEAFSEASVADVLRAWGRLGYPRRALRLHAAAREIVSTYSGRVPDTEADLRRLSGVGEYTAAAVASFAYERRALVLDTNVRRVLARLDAGVAFPTPSPTRAERERAAAFLPRTSSRAAHWNVAAMELGALICTAKSPHCPGCPVATDCAWLAAGRPAAETARVAQPWVGTDRRCRGMILAAARSGSVRRSDIGSLGADAAQAERCLTALIVDGLVEANDTWVYLPGDAPAFLRNH